MSALRAAPSWSGTWWLNTPTPLDDPLDKLEANKERVRLLLDRYGWINRDLVNRERLPVGSGGNAQGFWRWRDAFGALRIMELAGEVTMGHFVQDADTPQFSTPASINAMSANLRGAEHFWLAATDPLSPCGLAIASPGGRQLSGVQRRRTCACSRKLRRAIAVLCTLRPLRARTHKPSGGTFGAESSAQHQRQ